MASNSGDGRKSIERKLAASPKSKFWPIVRFKKRHNQSQSTIPPRSGQVGTSAEISAPFPAPTRHTKRRRCGCHNPGDDSQRGQTALSPAGSKRQPPPRPNALAEEALLKLTTKKRSPDTSTCRPVGNDVQVVMFTLQSSSVSSKSRNPHGCLTMHHHQQGSEQKIRQLRALKCTRCQH